MGAESSRVCSSLANADQVKEVGPPDVSVEKWDPEAWNTETVYVTKPGDTIDGICSQYYKTPEFLREHNPDLRTLPPPDDNQLVQGQSIVMPPTEQDRFMYYIKSAQRDVPKGQFSLARLYAGQGGRLEWRWVQYDPLLSKVERSEVIEDVAILSALNSAMMGGGGGADAAASSSSADQQKAKDATARLTKQRSKLHIRWLEKAASTDHLNPETDAMFELATIYHQGKAWDHLSDEEKRKQLSELQSDVQHHEWDSMLQHLHELHEKEKQELAAVDSELAEAPAGSEDEEEQKDATHVEMRNRAADLKEQLHKMWREKALELYTEAANRGDRKAAERLSEIYRSGDGVHMDYKEAIFWLEKAGRDTADAKKEIADWYIDISTKKGDKKAAYQLAIIYLYGVGVDMDFGHATFWYQQAGKSEQYAKKQIQRRFAALKHKYARLFNSHDHDGDGEITRDEFLHFYADTLQAKGFSRKAAEAEANGTYKGSKKADVMFKSYDVNNDQTISFEEVWAHPHTHTNLIVHTEQQLKAALKFFKKWDRKRKNKSLSGIAVYGPGGRRGSVVNTPAMTRKKSRSRKTSM